MTMPETDPWWIVGLTKQAIVKYVSVYDRTYGGNRLVNFVVRVGDNPNG